MYKNKSVSIILPAYNEELSISNFILEVKKLNIVDQIIAVNNNSTDNTEYEIKKNNVTYLNATKQGFGAAVKEGLYFSNTDLILICEPDGSFQANDILKLLNHIILNFGRSLTNFTFLLKISFHFLWIESNKCQAKIITMSG